MKKIILTCLCLCFKISILFAENIVFNNETNYPAIDKPGKIAVQWAPTTEAIQKANKSITVGSPLDVNSLMLLSQKGKIELTPPDAAHYFRVVVWSTDKKEPDFLTNWIDIVANKSYTLNQDQLIPAVLMSGSGC
ncbi:MAG: hypothetical protein Q8M03_02615 [Legionella sp.]|nr:hypothetical protein [Legionella sp.]